jgi:uncharacterized membrane protein
MDAIIHFMHLASSAIGIVGCLILIYGVAIGSLHWLKTERLFWTGQDAREEREALRHQLAYYLLLSLEFLIAADIIDTIVEPSLEELAILGAVLAIRTVISLSLNWELKSKGG